MNSKEDALGLVVFLFIQFIGSNSGGGGTQRGSYSKGREYLNWSPPGWIFGPVWLILKVLRGLAGYFFWSNAQASSDIDGVGYFTTILLYIINILLDIQWVPLFFQFKLSFLALIVLIGIFLTAVFVFVMFIINGVWLSFAFFIPYLAWLTIAFYLNYNWWSKMIWDKISVSGSSSSEELIQLEEGMYSSKVSKSNKNKNRSKPNSVGSITMKDNLSKKKKKKNGIISVNYENGAKGRISKDTLEKIKTNNNNNKGIISIQGGVGRTNPRHNNNKEINKKK